MSSNPAARNLFSLFQVRLLLPDWAERLLPIPAERLHRAGQFFQFLSKRPLSRITVLFDHEVEPS